MKMTRDQLKALIKECLVEVLAEGLGPLTEQKMVRRPVPVRESVAAPRRTALDSISYNQAPPPSRVNPEIIKNVTSDPIMSSIFQDTMNTTLVEQDSRGHNQNNPVPMVGGDRAARVVAESDPTELFGGEQMAARWSQAAFGKPRGPSRISQQLYDDFNPYSENSDINSR